MQASAQRRREARYAAERQGAGGVIRLSRLWSASAELLRRAARAERPLLHIRAMQLQALAQAVQRRGRRAAGPHRTRTARRSRGRRGSACGCSPGSGWAAGWGPRSRGARRAGPWRRRSAPGRACGSGGPPPRPPGPAARARSLPGARGSGWLAACRAAAGQRRGSGGLLLARQFESCAAPARPGARSQARSITGSHRATPPSSRLASGTRAAAYASARKRKPQRRRQPRRALGPPPRKPSTVQLQRIQRAPRV